MARRFGARACTALAGTALALAFLAACDGGDSGGDSPGARAGGSSSAAPGAPGDSAAGSPRVTQQSSDPGMRSGIEGARAALQAFLRGQAAGDPAVCRYVAPGGAFVRGPALKGDCERGVRNTPHLVRPAEREALRTVTVQDGRIVGEDAVVPFSALRWTSGSMVERTLQDKFTLRRQDMLWQIVK